MRREWGNCVRKKLLLHLLEQKSQPNISFSRKFLQTAKSNSSLPYKRRQGRIKDIIKMRGRAVYMLL